MSEGRGTAAGGVVGFLGMLTLLFIGLKLTGHVDWDWVWIVSPLWIPFAFAFGLFALVIWFLIMYVAAVAFVGLFSKGK